MSDIMENLFKQYHSRMKKGAGIKSIIFGSVIGFGVLFLSAFVIWLVDPNFFWIPFIAFAVTIILSTLVFYFAKFRPTIKDIARAIDDLGLQERMLTMVEYQNDTSFMATKQRADATMALSKVGAKLIRVVIATPAVIALVVAGFMGSGMATVSVLSKEGLLPSGDAFLEEILPEEEPNYVAVSYLVEGGGYIDGGDPEQLILRVDSEGEAYEKKTDTVTVVEEDGWMFMGWSDGYMQPTRSDSDLSEDLTVTAYLVQLAAMPGFGQGGTGQPGDGAPQDGPPGSSQENTNQAGQSSPFGSGHYEPSNQIIDGVTYYRESERFKQSYEEALEILENEGKLEDGEELPPELKAMLDSYYNVIN